MEKDYLLLQIQRGGIENEQIKANYSKLTSDFKEKLAQVQVQIRRDQLLSSQQKYKLKNQINLLLLENNKLIQTVKAHPGHFSSFSTGKKGQVRRLDFLKTLNDNPESTSENPTRSIYDGQPNIQEFRIASRLDTLEQESLIIPSISQKDEKEEIEEERGGLVGLGAYGGCRDIHVPCGVFSFHGNGCPALASASASCLSSSSSASAS